MSQAILASPLGTVYLNVTDYKLGLSSLLDNGQLKDGIEYYPIKALQDDLVFTAQHSSRDDLLAVQNFILSHFKKVGNSTPTDMIMRFYWPQMNFDYAGLMSSFQMGIKKFEYAPKRNYTMQLIRDSIYTITGTFSSAASWQSIYGNGVVSTVQGNPNLDPPFVPPTTPVTTSPGNLNPNGPLSGGGIGGKNVPPISIGGLLGIN